MINIELRFLANRYHGTSWGRHVNEGVAEWPPSPYRLLRAIYDAWKRKCTNLSENEVRDVFAALASNPPTFRLPKVVSAHTRSYLSSNTEDRSDKSLIFDAFVALHPKACCFLQWNVSLGTEQLRNLSQLLSSLNYLGRSESWVEARLAHDVDGQFTCRPMTENDAAKDVAYVACPVPLKEYHQKQPWLDALSFSSRDLLRDKLSSPPAMQYVPYALDPDAVTTWLPSRSSAPANRFSAAVLQLHGRILPMATETVRIAERVRGRLMRYFGKGPIPSMVHGKDANSIPLQDHSHLFILPRANRQGRIDHVLVWTRSENGFDNMVAEALTNLKSLVWMEPLRVIPAWMGKRDDERIRPWTKTVVSTTPFITVRHWRKGRGSELDFLKAEIERECQNHKLPKPARIEEHVNRIGLFFPSEFRRNREGDPSRKGTAFRLHFDQEVRTPFSLGYGCHFGLGQFDKG